MDWPNGIRPVTPTGWEVRSDGVWRASKTPRRVCYCPVGVIERVVSHTSEVWTLAWLDGREWRTIRASRSACLRPGGLAGMIDRGLPITSRTAGLAVDWLADFVAANQMILPIERIDDVDSR